MLKVVAYLLVIGVVLLLPILGSSFYYYNFIDEINSNGKRTVSLTFDDGPNPGETERLLEILDQYDVKATFFMNGKRAERHPDLVRKVYEHGHEIGNHGWTHDSLMQLTTSKPRDEIERTNTVLHAITGDKPKHFRAPYMAGGLGLAIAIQQLGMYQVGASVSVPDWEIVDPVEIYGKTVIQVKPGSIILLHDGDSDASDSGIQADRMPSVNAAALIVEDLQSKGYKFVPLQAIQ